MAELTEVECQLLTLERQWWRSGAAKQATVRELFGLSSAAYAVRLRRLAERPEALDHDPLLVRRLRRQWARQSEFRAAQPG